MITNFFKLYAITQGAERKKFYFLIFLLLILTILETLGVGIVIPLIAILLDEGLLKNYDIGLKYYLFIENIDFLGKFENFRFKIIFYSSLIIISFFLIKFLFTLFTSYYQQYFLFSFHQNLSSNIITKIINKNLNFHTQKNSSELISDLVEEINQIISIYVAYIQIFTEVIIFTFVSLIVLYSIKLQGFIIIVLFSITGILILFFTKKKLVNLGKKRQVHFVQKFNTLRDIFSSIKEIKILGVEYFFVNKFNFHNQELNKTSIPKRVYVEMPRSIMEFIAICIIFLIIISLSMSNLNSQDYIIFVIGLIVAASIKIFPSISKIISSSQTVKFGDVSIKKILKYLGNDYIDKIQELKKIEFKNKIVLNINSFSYPDNQKEILKNISIEILKNQSIGIFGPSGVGKSTLIDIIMGLQNLDGSKNILRVDDQNINNCLTSWRKKFGYVGQVIHFLNDTIEKNVAFGLKEEKIDKELVINSLKMADILDFVNGYPKKTKSILGESGLNISGGQRQRIGIARAFYQNPEILVFDEATTSLDSKSEKLIMKTISSYKGLKTMIIVSHKIENLSFCDHIIKL